MEKFKFMFYGACLAGALSIVGVIVWKIAMFLYFIKYIIYAILIVLALSTIIYLFYKIKGMLNGKKNSKKASNH